MKPKTQPLALALALVAFAGCKPQPPQRSTMPEQEAPTIAGGLAMPDLDSAARPDRLALLSLRLHAIAATSPGPTPGKIVHYCERWPDRCEPCPTCEGEPMLFACCNGAGGCWAVGAASDCETGNWLFPLDCEAGESAIDPASGEPIILCHDP